MLGFIHPDKGKIFVDGIPLSPTNKESIRNNFSYVPQKVQLIEGTLKENILFGSSEIDLDEAKLRETLRLANLDQVIESLPDGLETVLSDTNQYVSGGQKQCIGFARALYKGGNVLILDEATNAMDQNLEQRMMENISIAGFKMIIGITHKGSTLNYFNKICILKDGTLDGFDSLSELAKDNKFLLEMLR